MKFDGKRFLHLLGGVERWLTAAWFLVASLLVIVLQIIIAFVGLDVTWDRQAFIYWLFCGSVGFSIFQIICHFLFRKGFMETCTIAGNTGRMPDTFWKRSADKHE